MERRSFFLEKWFRHRGLIRRLCHRPLSSSQRLLIFARTLFKLSVCSVSLSIQTRRDTEVMCAGEDPAVTYSIDNQIIRLCRPCLSEKFETSRFRWEGFFEKSNGLSHRG